MSKDMRKLVKEFLLHPDIRSIVDFGCGSSPITAGTSYDGSRRVIGIDADFHGVECAQKVLEEVWPLNMVDDLMEIILKVRELPRPRVAVFADSLEHVTFEEACEIIEELKREFGIILAFLPEGNTGDNPWDEGFMKHRHHWQVVDVYRCFGRKNVFVKYMLEYHGEGKSAIFVMWADDTPLAFEAISRVVGFYETS